MAAGGDQLAGDLADALLHPALAPLPRLAAELVERRAFLRRAVAAEHLEILDRHVELVAAGIAERDAIVRRLLHRDLGQPLVAADAVVGMDDQVARRERRQLLEEGVGILAAPGAADQAVAEHVLLGEHRHLGRGEAVIERQDDERDARRAQRLLPRIGDRGAGEAVILEQTLQPLARAARIAGEHGLAALAPQLAEVRDHRFVDVRPRAALGREVARAVDVEVDHPRALGFVEGRGQMRGGVGEPLRPSVARKVERIGLDRAIAAGVARLGALAIGEIVGDRLEARIGRARIARVAQHQRVAGQVIEQGLQPLLEQRQPMLHARQPSPVADRLVERIARRSGAEALAVARAEAADAVLVEQRLARGEQGEALDAAGGALVAGIEGAHALDLVAEEIEPQRLLGSAREEIDEPAAHRELARIADRVDADISVRLELRRQPVERDALARREPRHELADAEGRERALGGGVDGGEEQPRMLGGVWSAWSAASRSAITRKVGEARS